MLRNFDRKRSFLHNRNKRFSEHAETVGSKAFRRRLEAATRAKAGKSVNTKFSTIFKSPKKNKKFKKPPKNVFKENLGKTKQLLSNKQFSQISFWGKNYSFGKKPKNRNKLAKSSSSCKNPNCFKKPKINILENEIPKTFDPNSKENDW